MNRADDSFQMILHNIITKMIDGGEDIADFKVDKVDKETQEITAKSANILLEKLKLRNKEKSKEGKEIEREFEAAVFKTWRKPLDLLDLLLYMSLEVASEFKSEGVSEASLKRNYIRMALTKQQANACLVFNEIIHLLKSGFPSGAYLQWKALHEIACMSYFISKHGDDIAKRYLDYEAVENFFQAQIIRENQKAMDCKFLSEKEFKAVRRKFNKMRKTYGENFVKKSNYPYGWVPRTVLKTRSLREIEKVVRLDMLRPYYNLASYNIHGGPRGLIFKLGILDTKSRTVVLPVGPVNYGLADPGKVAAISMGQTSASLLNYEATIKSMVVVEAMRDLVDEICCTFCEIKADFSKLCTKREK